MATADNENMTSQVNHVRHVLAVASGKGGVGKSLVAAMAAVELARSGLKVGIMDADITGPSIPRLFGMTARPESSMMGILPPETALGIKIISMNLFLDNSGQAVIWRGPLLTSAIKQFWTDIAWGDLDVLIVDLPPGTADVPLTAFQTLPVDGILMVTTPQELASMIVEKAAGLAKQMHKTVLGIVENMAMAQCPHCGETFELFGPSHAQELADRIGAPRPCTAAHRFQGDHAGRHWPRGRRTDAVLRPGHRGPGGVHCDTVHCLCRSESHLPTAYPAMFQLTAGDC